MDELAQVIAEQLLDPDNDTNRAVALAEILVGMEDMRGEKKSFNSYVEKKGPPYSYSSTQFNLRDAGYDRNKTRPMTTFRAIVDAIDDADLAGDGKEDVPHITVKYGLHTADIQDVARIVQGFGPVEIILGGVSAFYADDESAQRGGRDFDVLKIDVFGDRLFELNKLIADSLEHTDSFPEYKPHVTIAYLKPGLADKYLQSEKLVDPSGIRMVCDRLQFSDKAGNKQLIDIASIKNKAVNGVKKSVKQNNPISIQLPDLSQGTDYSCGAVCLQAIAEYFGVGPETENAFIEALQADPNNGIPPERIIEYAKQLGLEVEPRDKRDLNDLQDQMKSGRPVLVLIQAYGGDAGNDVGTENGHYVVVIGIDQQNVYVEDPMLKGSRGVIPLEQFVPRWKDAGADGKPYVRYGISFFRGQRFEPVKQVKKGDSGGTCKPGERADLTGCTPASGGSGGGNKEQESTSQEGGTKFDKDLAAWEKRTEERDTLRDSVESVLSYWAAEWESSWDVLATEVESFTNEDRSNGEGLSKAASEAGAKLQQHVEDIITGLEDVATDKQIAKVRVLGEKAKAAFDKYAAKYEALSEKLTAARAEFDKVNLDEPEIPDYPAEPVGEEPQEEPEPPLDVGDEPKEEDYNGDHGAFTDAHESWVAEHEEFLELTAKYEEELPRVQAENEKKEAEYQAAYDQWERETDSLERDYNRALSKWESQMDKVESKVQGLEAKVDDLMEAAWDAVSAVTGDIEDLVSGIQDEIIARLDAEAEADPEPEAPEDEREYNAPKEPAKPAAPSEPAEASKPISNLPSKSLNGIIRKDGGTCKPGERSDLTGCTPASGGSSGSSEGESTPTEDAGPHQALHAKATKKAKKVVESFQKAYDKVTSVPVLKQVRQVGDKVKGLTKKMYDRLEKRYGKKTAIAIMASGQAFGWGATGAGAAVGVPIYLPGSTLWGSLPAVALAEAYLQAKAGVSSVSGMLGITQRKSMDDSKFELDAKKIEELGRAEAASLERQYLKLLKGSMDDIVRAESEGEASAKKPVSRLKK